MKTITLPWCSRLRVLRLMVLTLCLGALALRGVPPTIQYQGYLTDADNAPVTGVLDLVFRLYEDADPAAAPTPVWEEAHYDVPVLDGRVARVLGQSTPFADAGVTFDDPLFLELQIGGEPLTPRIALQSAPYALKAGGVVPAGVTADMLAQGAVTAGKADASLAGAGLVIDESGALSIAPGGVQREMMAPEIVTDEHIAIDAAINPAKIEGTAVTLSAEQVLENKTLDATLNTIQNLTLDAFAPAVIVTDLSPADKLHDTLPTADAVIAYVDASDALSELTDTSIVAPSAGQLLLADSDGRWHNRSVMGDLSIAPDGRASITADAVLLGDDTVGPYVAGLTAGSGLSGGGSGESAVLDLAVNVDGDTLQIVSDALEVAPDGIAAVHLAPGIDATDKAFKAYEAIHADKVDGADVDDEAGPAADVLWSSSGTVTYLGTTLAARSWQDPVQAMVTAMPTAPSEGDRVIALSVPGRTPNSIYTFAEETWKETPPTAGFAAWIDAQNTPYMFDGLQWQPVAGTLDHNLLSGLQGGDGADFFHLPGALYEALTSVGTDRLLAAEEGLPVPTSLAEWIAGSPAQILVADDGNGGVTLSLPQPIAPASMPAFAGLTIADMPVSAISNDPSLTAARVDALPTEAAVKAYVDSRHAASDTLAELLDTAVAETASGDFLQFDGNRWVNVPVIPGEGVQLSPSGGLTHAAGLMLDLSDDGSLVISGNQVGVGTVGSGHVAADAVQLGFHTAGDYLAGITTGNGLSGGATGEGLLPELSVLTDGDSIVFDEGGNLTVNGTAVNAGQVDGADVDDSAAADPAILWSSQRIQDVLSTSLSVLEWQPSVIAIGVPEGSSPTAGERYIAPMGTDAMTPAEWSPGWIYEFDGTQWKGVAPEEGFTAWVDSEDRAYVFDGSQWLTAGSTQNHEELSGLQGGTAGEHFHLQQALHDALNGLAPQRLVATDIANMPVTTTLSEWVRDTPGDITVNADADGGITLGLHGNVPSATPTADHILMGNGSDWIALPQSSIAEVGTISAGTWQGNPIDGDYIVLGDLGGIVAGSGLKVNLDPADTTLTVDVSNYLKVNTIGSANLGTGVIQTVHLDTQAVTGEKIAPASIPDSKLQTVQTPNKVSGTAVQLQPGGGLLADTTGLGVNPALLAVSCPNIVTVCAGESIQAAIDSIKDSTAANPYLIRVGPGVYPETIQLISHVDIEGAGIGKTVIRGSGAIPPPAKATTASGTVLATEVVNAGMRHLTIESTRAEDGYELGGVYYGGVPAGTGLHLLHVQINVTTTGTAVSAGAWGIAGSGNGIRGLLLQHVSINVNAATDGALVYGIDLVGDLTMEDCSIAAHNPAVGGAAVGMEFLNLGTGVEIHRSSIAVQGSATRTVSNIGFNALGSGTTALVDCTILTQQDNSRGVAVPSDGLTVQLKRSTVRHESEATTPVGVEKLWLMSGRLELHQCDVLGVGDALAIPNEAGASVYAYYSVLQGPRADELAAVTKYVRCVELDASGNPVAELQSALP